MMGVKGSYFVNINGADLYSLAQTDLVEASLAGDANIPKNECSPRMISSIE
jgi:hypothetical protein